MTGFGAAQSAASKKGEATLRVEVRTVNHKFLQVKIRLPSELSFLEVELEDLVRKRLERGAVQLNVFTSGAVGVETVAIDRELAKRYRRELAKLATELGLEPTLDARALVGMPGVLGSSVDAKTLKAREKQVLALCEQALDDLGRMREREGQAIARDLRKHVGAIEKLVGAIEKRMPDVVRAHRESLVARVQELVGHAATIQPADLAREIALLADKLDVSEELARLASHLGQLEVILAREGPVGRQLDFLIQELFREANTIGSKCSDAPVAHRVVELKTSIERLREQTQNVE